MRFSLLLSLITASMLNKAQAQAPVSPFGDGSTYGNGATGIANSLLGGSTSSNRFQLGLAAMEYNSSKYEDESGLGLGVEGGWLMDNTPIDLVLGVRGMYVDGVGGSPDIDVLDGSLFGRFLMPLMIDSLKLYGEGRVGFGNLSVTGRTGASTTVNGREVSVNRKIDNDDWTFGWGLGGGVQLDVTTGLGLRVGYDLQSYGDLEVLDLKVDTGFMHGFSAALIFKF